MNEISNVIVTSQVEVNDKGVRLDKFLAQNVKTMSRAQVQRLITLGFVSCDDNIIVDLLTNYKFEVELIEC